MSRLAAIQEPLIFKTNIRFHKDVQKVAVLLNKHPEIVRWNVDTEDVDKVLRIEPDNMLAEEVILLLSKAGFFCEELPD